MNDFQFRLQSVEKLRLRRRDEAAESLRQAEEAKGHLEMQIEQLLAEIGEQSSLQGQAATGTIETQRLLESQRYQLHLHGQVGALREKVALIDQECHRRKQLLIDRETETRAMEKLRDTQFAQWQQAQSVRQQQHLDEWAGYRHWITAQAEASRPESSRES